MAKKIIGIDLGGTTIKFGFLDSEGNILTKWNIPTNIEEEGNHIVPEMIASIKEQMRKEDLRTEDFFGIGMGTPGTIDQEAGTVIGAYNLNWKTTQYIGKQIEEGLNLPIIIENDANSAALGEFWRGAGNHTKDAVFVTLGTGVGGGVIVDGHLVHGANGGGGEIGHITVEDGGYMCTCGKRGCLERYASATGIVQLAKDMARDFTGHSQLKELEDSNQNVSAKTVFYLADNGDILANQVVDKVCSYLGKSLSYLGNAINPESIIIGGGVSNAGNTLLQPTTHYFQRNAFPTVKDSTRLKLAQLGNDAGLIGAASLALRFKD